MPAVAKTEDGRYTLRYLELQPTLHQGHFDDLKIASPATRVWLSRCDVADGMPYDHQVVVEKLIDGSWIAVETYPAA